MATERLNAPATSEAELVSRLQTAIETSNIPDRFLYETIQDTFKLYGGEAWQDFDEQEFRGQERTLFFGFDESDEFQPYDRSWLEIHPNVQGQEATNYEFRNKNGHIEVVKESLQVDSEEPIDLDIATRIQIASDLIFGIETTPIETPNTP